MSSSIEQMTQDDILYLNGEVFMGYRSITNEAIVERLMEINKLIEQHKAKSMELCKDLAINLERSALEGCSAEAQSIILHEINQKIEFTWFLVGELSSEKRAFEDILKKTDHLEYEQYQKNKSGE